MKLIIKILPILVLFACYRESDYVSSSFAEINKSIILDPVDTALLADGESTTLINIYLPSDIKTEINSLKVSTSNGMFGESDNITVPIISDKENRVKAQVKLRASTKVQAHIIRVDVGPYFVTSKIESKPALPEYFETKLPLLKIKVDSSKDLSIETYPKRLVGKVSDGTEINIKVVDENGNDGWGVFLNRQNIFSGTSKLENTFYYLKNCHCEKLYIVYNTKPGQKPDVEKDAFFITK